MFLIHIAKCGPLPMLCAVIISFPHLQDGFTPVYVACQNGHKQIVNFLLEGGANVNLTTVSSLSGAYSELSSWLQHIYIYTVLKHILSRKMDTMALLLAC